MRRLYVRWGAMWNRGSGWLIAVFVVLGAANVALGAWWSAMAAAFALGLLISSNLHRRTRPAEPPSTAEAMAQVLDQMHQLEEAARGYRARLERMGWSPTAAENMALQFHAGLVTSAFTPRKG